MTNLLIKWFIKDGDVNNPKIREQYGELSSFTGIACNIVLFAVKFVMGMISGSIAVTSDAFNNLSDSLSCIVTLVSYKLAAKPADKDHPFGHGRIEYLSSLFIAVLIIMVGFEFLKSSFDKVLHPTPITFNIVVVASLIVSVFVKIWLYSFNKKLGTITKSSTMLATATDSLSDAVTTTVTVGSFILSLVIEMPVDGFIGLFVSFLIMKAGYGVMKDTVDTLLGKPADDETVKAVMDIIYSYDIVLGVHDMIVHNYGPGNVMASLHVEVDSKCNILEAHDQIDRIEAELGEKLHIMTTIHMDPIETDNVMLNELREFVSKVLLEIDERITMHDFRMVPGDSHTNLIFDVVLPYDIASNRKKIKEDIDRRVSAKYPNHLTVITFDTDFNEAVR